jgi:DNA/RNA-binding domain of Phe-tRNA-synthetase-like protein
MIFEVAKSCVALGLRAMAVVIRGVRVAEEAPALREEIAREMVVLRTRFPDPQAVRSLPEVVAFQEILRKVSVNPRKLQPSVERLLGFALKRGDLPAINSLVDAYNLVSTRSLCSLGAHDLDRITLPVTLRMLTGRETFTPLGQDGAVPVIAGEFGYVDAADRLLCRLDVMQADFSKVTTRTANILLIIEGTTAAHSLDLLRRTFTEAVDLITRQCGGAAEVAANPDN